MGTSMSPKKKKDPQSPQTFAVKKTLICWICFSYLEFQTIRLVQKANK